MLESPESYLDHLMKDKELNQLLHFSNLVQAKYVQAMSQKYIEQLSQNPGAAPPQMPAMPGFPPGVGM